MISNLSLVKNIKQILLCNDKPVPFLKGQAMSILPELKDAYIIIEDDCIHSFGPNNNIPDLHYDKIVDADHGFVFPSFVDSHTHLVFAAWRETEFMDRINGLSYEQISQRGGGILNSAKKIAEIDEDELFDISLKKLNKVISHGTGAIEIKSGYGLSTESEIKMLKVIQRLKKVSPITIKSTFLGAHSFPLEYRNNQDGYVDLIVNEMLPEIAKQNLADYCDVFCERNFFSVEQSKTILLAAQKLGMQSRIHTNQFTHSGGIALAAEINAISVDHLEELNDSEIDQLQNSKIIPCLLPGAAFFMNCSFPPALKMLDKNLGFSIASDFNPGTCPIWNMNTIFQLSVIKMRLNTQQALAGLTVNGAYALGIDDQQGSIFPNALANLIITKQISSLDYIPYAVNDDCIAKIIIKGLEIKR